MKRNRLSKTKAYDLFVDGKSEAITLQDFYEVARVNEYFQTKARQRRYTIIANAVSDDDTLSKLWDLLQNEIFRGDEMMPRQQSIEVTSHVARDFLQNAAYFNTMPKVVWEYVANSLDAVKDDIYTIIAVELTSNEFSISDNGRGMSRSELGSFFQMHGENILRKQGKRVRGRFGTGKCAAFGLANSLLIDTVQAGIRNVVELRRKDIEQAQGGEPFSVRDIEADQPTSEDDGSMVVIRELNIKRLDVDKVISYVERHLSHYRPRAHVTVNGHACKFKEPPFVAQLERFPPTKVAKLIGDVCLNVKVSPVPLDDDTRGIDILSHGIWHETTLEGIEKKRERESNFWADRCAGFWRMVNGQFRLLTTREITR